MQQLLFVSLLLLSFFAYSATAQPSFCTAQDQSATYVFGASTLYEEGDSYPTTASNIYYPYGVTTNSGGNQVYASDYYNHRVLRYTYNKGQNFGLAASVVFGQPSTTASTGATTQTGLYYPREVAFGSYGAKTFLFVVDSSNYRVVRYDNPGSVAANGPKGAQVIGQVSWTSTNTARSANNFGGYPSCVTYDSETDKLWVGDYYNSRVMRFDGITAGPAVNPAANKFIGVTSATAYSSGDVDQYYIGYVEGCEFDPAHNSLYVVDYYYNRILRFDNARSHGNLPAAAAVFGQANFDSYVSGTTALNFDEPYGVAVDPPNDVLYAVDTYQSRILIFKAASTKTTNPQAPLVMGQPDFISNEANQNQAVPTDKTFDNPNDAFYNPATKMLWVADTRNNRVLGFQGCLVSVTKSKSKASAGGTKSKSKTRSRTRSRSRSKSRSRP